MIELALRWADGREATVPCRPDESVLDAAERAGIALPFGCRIGACATCTGHLRSGELHHTREPRALRDRHLDAGYALLCIARPGSDCRIDVGAAVARELVANPWK